jgi:hypothetical protein
MTEKVSLLLEFIEVRDKFFVVGKSFKGFASFRYMAPKCLFDRFTLGERLLTPVHPGTG